MILTIFLRYVFLGLSRPVTEGRLISVSRRGAGSGGRDMTLHRRCGAGPGGPSRASSGVPIRTPGAVTAARRTVLPSQECRRMPGPKDGGVVTQQVSPSRGGADHRGGCGASLKHRARDALGLADLRHALPIARTRVKGEAHRTSTSLDVARRRGPRVQLDPWRPARPRLGAGGKRAKKTGLPGASIKNTGDGACAVRCRTKQSRV